MSLNVDGPVAFFDSGSGGLAVLKHFRERFPLESTVYLADFAHFPYGEKSQEKIIDLALKNGRFLEEKGAKLIVVACNTASSFSVGILKKHLRIPVLGAVQPTVKKVARVSKNRRIGVLATQNVVTSKTYEKAILEEIPDATIFSKACPPLASLVEAGLASHPGVFLLIRESIQKMLDEGIDTLVLGCTHYSLIKPHLNRLVNNSVVLVDSSEACVEAVISFLEAKDLIRQGREEKFFVTGGKDKLSQIAPHFLGRPISSVELLGEAQNGYPKKESTQPKFFKDYLINPLDQEKISLFRGMTSS